MAMELVNFRVELDDIEIVDRMAMEKFPQSDETGNRSAMLREIVHTWVEQYYAPKEVFHNAPNIGLVRIVYRGDAQIDSVEVVK